MLELDADNWTNIFPDGSSDSSGGWTDILLAAANDPKYPEGKPIRANGTYLINSQIFVGDIPVNIIGSGTFLQKQGQRVFQVQRSLTNQQTVTSVSQISIGAANSIAPQASLNVTKISCTNANSFKRDDIVKIDAESPYPWSAQFSAEVGILNVYVSDIVQLMGIGQDYTSKQNGGFSQGDQVTGAISNNTAIVNAVGNNGLSTDTVIFQSMSGPFQNGEQLKVGTTVRGMASGPAYLLTADLLVYGSSYTTNVSVRNMTKSKFRMDGISVKAVGDVDSIVGSAQRREAFLFQGLVDPEITNFTIKSAWTRCFRFQSCWRPRVGNLHIEKLPNNANPSEQAYGYGIDICGATAHADVWGMTGGNCRHAFTTTCDGPSSGTYSAWPLYANGAPKYNTVRDSHIVNSRAEAFDTHPGDIYTSFVNCIAEWPSGTGLQITAPGGFKTRGFATRFENCRSIGGTYGFNDYSGVYNSGFAYVQRFIGCGAERSTGYGYYISQTPNQAEQRRSQFENCYYNGAASPTVTLFVQTGWYGEKSTDFTLINCSAACFTGPPFQIGTSQRWVVRGFVADYRDAGANASPPRIAPLPATAAPPTLVSISGLEIIPSNTNAAMPPAILQNNTSFAVEVELKDSFIARGALTPYETRPQVQNSAGGSTSITYKDDANNIFFGAAPPTIAGRVGDKVKNTVPAAGGYEGWVCVSAGPPSMWKGYGKIET
jgi:hypothetical protein